MTRKQWLQELLIRSADGRFPSIAPHKVYGVQCAYRDPKGNACAAGLLIPDAEYRASFEGASAFALCETGAVTLPEGVTLQMLVYAQAAHDTTAVERSEPAGLAYVAKPWDHAAFLNELRKSPELVRAFAEEGLVIE